MAGPCRVVAIVSAYNEGDIIGAVIGHLAENGVDTYLIDNRSTDDTVAQAERWRGRGLMGLELLPSEMPPDPEESRFDWTAVLRRKEALARELGADWYIHHDADEIRESPWPGMTLREAIAWADARGYNAINFHVFNFHPVDDGFRQGDDPRTYFKHYAEAADFDRLQVKAWKASSGPVSLTDSGGHHVAFAGRRVFPIPFPLRHYPIRGQTHGLRKVFADRKARFTPGERAQGWHLQYDRVEDETHRFLRDPSELQTFDLDEARMTCFLPDSLGRHLADRLLRLDAELDVLRQHRHALEESVAEHRVQLATALSVARDQAHDDTDRTAVLENELRSSREAQQADRRGFETALAAAEQRAADCETHIATLEHQLRVARHEADEAARQSASSHQTAGQLSSLRQETQVLATRLESAEAERAQAERRLNDALRDLDVLRNSRSWRWTEPLRLVKDRFER